MRYHVGYLTSYPLVTLKTRQDASPEPIKLLRLQRDVDETREALSVINKAVRIRFEHASVQNFGDLLNKGCKVMHYSGHVRLWSVSPVGSLCLSLSVSLFLSLSVFHRPF